MRDRVTAYQIRAIKTLQGKAGLDDDAYRALLMGHGVTSSKDLSLPQAAAFIDVLRGLAPAAADGARRPSATASGPYAGILRALWLSAFNLGVARVRDDAALIAFVERQTGLAHTRFLRDAADAMKAIEALKGWIAREGGVDWPKRTRDRDAGLKALKCAVLEAQWRRLIAAGAVEPFGAAQHHAGLADYVSKKVIGTTRRIGSVHDPILTAAQLDEASRELGRWVRAALAKQGEQAKGAA